MAQLIKLQDYISRYETDVYRYPSRFVRLKKQQWEKVLKEWERQKWQVEILQPDTTDEWELSEEEPAGMFQKFKSLFQKDSAEDAEQADEAETVPDKEEVLFQIDSQSVAHENELKQHFLDEMLKFQVKWASSTLTEKSYIDYKYFRDERLKLLLQRFPDTFLVLYEPIFKFKNAPVELDILLITPTAVWCVTFLEEEDEAVYIGSQERFWGKRTGDIQSRVLSPVLSLNRMETLVRQLFRLNDVELPIKKAIISRNGFLDYPSAPQDLHLIDERRFESWFTQLRNLKSPLKTAQLKAAKSLLAYAQTTSVRRPEWEEGDTFLFLHEEDQERN
ncbi:hypothetical protein JOC78_002649 [Bacillus ectoiniformans]|uniref:nuclease-related domain-containing protein n=1 Tax=Bacillus ectoiniformans TaxID=1494429 RepID=UPI00195A51EC|nr:nuclease-related domain-containing protein [Bacillus ectoiniformans]MBM7649675.1 hypothetical protein [Bacillus ectoiniformans]